MTLKLNGSTSGYTAIDAPASAGSNTLVLPTSNGSANQVLKTDGSGNLSWVAQTAAATNTPAFQVNNSGAGDHQTIASGGTQVKVEFATEVLDTDGCYDNSSNYRFTPTTAGKYFVYSTLHCNATAANNFLLGTTTIKKNGSNIIYSQMDQRTTGNGYSNAVN